VWCRSKGMARARHVPAKASGQDQPEIEGGHHETQVQQRPSYEVHDGVIEASAERRIRMRDDGDVAVPSRVAGRWARQAGGMVNPAIKRGLVVDAGNGEAQRRLRQHLVGETWSFMREGEEGKSERAAWLQGRKRRERRELRARAAVGGF
jgi:hypothetical protein